MELVNDVEQSRNDHVVIFIKDKLARQMAPFVLNCSIHRVPIKLFNQNRNAYVPKVISIGPFHHNERKFKDTEELKIRFFESYLCRVGLSVENIVEKARSWEKEARENYSRVNNMDSEEFVKMMVLDGCFIIELMIMDMPDIFPKDKNEVYSSSFFSAIKLDISVELLMLENQLPIFVLRNLFDLVYPTRSQTTCTKLSKYNRIGLFDEVVHNFLKLCMFSIKKVVLARSALYERPCHLLDYLSSYFIPKMDKMDEMDLDEMHEMDRMIVPSTNTFLVEKFLPPSATQLNEAGIVFKKVEEKGKTCIMDISFKNGVLNIPPLLIDDAFETCARNLLAFAQFSYEKNGWFIIHYFEFLDELITTEKDVNLLMKKGIIVNRIGGSEKEIANLFNNICKNITVGETNFFSHTAKALKQHCDKRWHRWMALLKHNHFNTPWALISVLAAIFLIILTLLQTISSGISIYK